MMNNTLNAPSTGFEGFYLIEVIQQDGTLKQGAGLNAPFKNLLLNTLFTAMSPIATTQPTMYCCRVGTSSTPPSVTDTALGAQLAISSTYSAIVGTFASNATDGYWRQESRVFTFEVGAVVGNISEVGISTYNNVLLISRSLIKDTGGSPTTITLTATDQLKVTYSIRRTQPTTTTNGTLTLVRDGVTEYHPWVWYPNSASSSRPEVLATFNNIAGSGDICYTGGTPSPNTFLSFPTPYYEYQTGTKTGATYNATTKTITVTYNFPIGTSFPNGFNVYRPLAQVDGEGYFYFPTPVVKTALQSLSITSSYSMVAL